MNWAIKRRPKGYNTKVWKYCVEEAVKNKKWALDTLLNNPEWAKRASQSSIEMLGERLYKNELILAKEHYDYFEMRSHGYTWVGLLDPTMHKKWVEITSRKINKAKMWKYDHTNNTTAAYKDNGKWKHWLNGREL